MTTDQQLRDATRAFREIESEGKVYELTPAGELLARAYKEGEALKADNARLWEALDDLYRWADQWKDKVRYKRSTEYCEAMDRAEKALAAIKPRKVSAEAQKRSDELVDALLDVEPEDESDMVCPTCGDSSCNRPWGHPVDED